MTVVGSSVWIIVLTVGQWFGYVTFGFVADALGRKRAYLTYLLVAAVLVPLYGSTRNLVALLMLGPFVAFFGTGYFSGFGTVSAELFPTRIRATAQGLTYNIGRVASAAAPFAVGELAEVYGLGAAFDLTAVAFLFSAALAAFIPETRGKVLELITSAPQRRGTPTGRAPTHGQSRRASPGLGTFDRLPTNGGATVAAPRRIPVWFRRRTGQPIPSREVRGHR